jgi:hypothetical protein
MGGEEFFCILPNTNSAAATKMMQKIQASINALNIPHAASPIEPFLTVSIGACIKKDSDNIDAMSLYQLADKALYTAKEQGRNTFITKNPPPKPPNHSHRSSKQQSCATQQKNAGFMTPKDNRETTPLFSYPI